jgi:hypothetical protein
LSSVRIVASIRKLREEPLWGLLAADTGPEVIGLLQTLLLDNEKELTGEVLIERLTRELGELNIKGFELSQTAQGYISNWLTRRWLTRRLPTGASEEVYELTADAANAIRFVNSLLKPRASATESRLAAVISQLVRLAEETDPDPESRVVSLLAERDRLDRAIAAVRKGAAKTLDEDRAVERAREVIALSDELAADFRTVRDQFDKLNRSLRETLLDNEGSRGEVLEQLFEGIDLIGESDAGRTFGAFWKLLTDPEQSALLSDALDDIARRPFAAKLESRERKFLLNLTGLLMNEGAGVHDVLQNFARSLKSFVQSREFLEQRRLHTLLQAAQQAALEAKEKVRPSQPIGFELGLTSSNVNSVSRWVLYDPQTGVLDARMQDAAPADVTLDEILHLVRQAEIDFRTLRQHIRDALAISSQVSIGDLLSIYPAEQGLGSVIGYVSLGVKHGEAHDHAARELVQWEGDDGVARRARIPAIYFVRKNLVELAD